MRRDLKDQKSHYGEGQGTRPLIHSPPAHFPWPFVSFHSPLCVSMTDFLVAVGVASHHPVVDAAGTLEILFFYPET
jgi:hypothetical protein